MLPTNPEPDSSIARFLVSQLLSEDASAQYSSGRIAKSTLAPFVESIRSISARYTSHRVGRSLGPSVESDREAVAYALYYVPINFAKISWLLTSLSLPKNCSVLDYGSGPGTGALATLFSPHPPAEIACIDHSVAMRSVAQTLFRPFASSATPPRIVCAAGLNDLPSEKRYHLIIAANVLAEMEDTTSVALLNALQERLHEYGYLMLIEPGQPDHTRRLMSLRDSLCEKYPNLTPTFPCCTQGPCPMLASSTDNWCHGTLSWERPLLTQQFDESLEFNKHRLKYSAFIFQMNGVLKNGYRIIEPGARSKRGIEAVLCGKDFYGPVRLKPANRSEENRPLERGEVFDLIELDCLPRANLPPNTKVKRVV
jgi:ribosomal protein RSM22 (predicted rRNA methylase)